MIVKNYCSHYSDMYSKILKLPPVGQWVCDKSCDDKYLEVTGNWKMPKNTFLYLTLTVDVNDEPLLHCPNAEYTISYTKWRVACLSPMSFAFQSASSCVMGLVLSSSGRNR